MTMSQRNCSGFFCLTSCAQSVLEPQNGEIILLMEIRKTMNA